MRSSGSYYASDESNAVFCTDRLKVLRWRSSDEASLLDVYGNRDVVRWVDDGQPLSPEEAAQWMKVTRANYTKYGYGMYTIEDLTSARVLGFGELIHPNKQVDAEVKYALLPEFWGQGIATEFVKGLVKHGSHVHKLTRIIATVAKANHPSQHVLRRCGFKYSATQVEEDGAETDVFDWHA